MAQKKKRKRTEKTNGRVSLQRALVTGAGLGLYFGLFFRPVREPNLLMALGLGLVAALVMTLLNLRREEGRAPRALARYALGAWLLLTLALLVLEGRHLVHDVAGRTGVTIYTTAAGALAGAWYARRQSMQAAVEQPPPGRRK